MDCRMAARQKKQQDGFPQYTYKLHQQRFDQREPILYRLDQRKYVGHIPHYKEQTQPLDHGIARRSTQLKTGCITLREDKKKRCCLKVEKSNQKRSNPWLSKPARSILALLPMATSN
jgi:hypothetical protein